MSSVKEEALEAYILSGCDKKALAGLIKGSDSSELLNCLHILNSSEALSKEEISRIQAYISGFSTEGSRKIEYRYILRRYDEGSEEERMGILGELKEKLGMILDEYPPAELQKGVDLAVKEKTAPNHLSKEILDIRTQLDKLYKEKLTISEFNSPEILSVVNFEKLKDEDFLALCRSSPGITGVMTDQFFQKLHSLLRVDIYKHKYLSNSQVLQNLSLKQLDIISNKYPRIKEEDSFIGNFLQKKFARELDSNLQELISRPEKQINLMAIYQYAKSLPKKFESLRVDVLLEILENGIKLNDYAFDLFEEYLRKPGRRTEITIHKDIEERGKWSEYIGNIQKASNRRGSSYHSSAAEGDLVREYLTVWFKEKKNFNKWKGLVEDKYLNSVLDGLKQDSGVNVELTKENSTMLEKLASESFIKFKGENKELFEISENVTVKLSVKNIERMWIKVFEMNSENYYRDRLAPFQTDVNLEGVVASFESMEETRESLGGIVLEKELDLEMLRGKIGLFIVEIIGGGCSSRAVIKIGTLSWVYKSTMIGQIAYIISPERKICVGEHTGLWLDNQFFAADPKTGRMVIPYATREHASKVILIHHSIAQLVNFIRPSALFSFSSTFLLPSESLIMGNLATIIVKPSLTLNGLKAPLKMLTTFTATINTSSYIDDIPHSKTFTNLVPTETGEIKLTFNVAPALNSLSVEVRTQLYNQTANKTEEFHDSKSFDLDSHSERPQICSLFLKKRGGEYSVEMLGKNGEPKAGNFIQVSLLSKFMNREIKETLETDTEGIIRLGDLRDVRKVKTKVDIDSHTIQREWTLGDQNTYMYPDSVDIINHEPLQFPVDFNLQLDPLTTNLISLSSHDTPIDSHFSCLGITQVEEGLRYSKLTINGLDEGKYVLFFPMGKDTKYINIEAHNGVYWSEAEGYILKKYSLIESMQRHKIIKIGKIDVEKERTLIHLRDTNADPRVHFMAFNFMPPDIMNYISELRNNIETTFSSTQYFFQKWDNFYLSNRQLGTEYRYVFDRKHLKAYTGITLDKPKLLLKRVFTRGTKTTEEEIIEAEAFQDMKEQALEKQMQSYATKKQKVISGAATKRRKCMNISGKHKEEARSNIEMYQNFLETEPYIVCNAYPDESGVVVIDGDMRAYNTLLVIAVDSHSVTQSIAPSLSPQPPLQKRDLTLLSSLDQTKYYSQQREATLLLPGEKLLFPDMNSVQLQIIDSLEKVLQVLKLLTQIKGNIQYLDEFTTLLLGWDLLTIQQKHQQLSKYTSHELHIFLKFKDNQYFQAFVKPYLANKLEKSFIDFYLLEDIESLLSYLDPRLLEELNAMERAFLVESLADVRPEEAAFVVQNIMEQNEFKKTSMQEQNRIFDAILSLQVMDEVVKEEDEREDEPRRRTGGKIHGGLAYTMDKSKKKEKSGRQKEKKKGRKSKKKNDDYNDLFCIEEEMKMDMPYDLNQRGRAIVEEMEETKEYAETHYYKQTVEGSGMRSKSSKFWEAYAVHCVQHKRGTPFISEWFWGCTWGIADVVGCVSVVSLPQKSGEHRWKGMGTTSMELESGSRCIVITKQVKESKGERTEHKTGSVLVGQKLWKYKEERLKGWEIAGGEEILANSMIGVEVVISNMGGEAEEVNCLIQVPRGAIPLGDSSYTTSKAFRLSGYSTTTFEYSLYFPHPGQFMHYGPTVSIGGTVVGSASSTLCNVVSKRTIISSENFMDVVAAGDKGNILQFIEEKNIFNPKYGFSWHYVYWMLHSDPEFFSALLSLLMKKKIFVQQVWAYSFNHNHKEGVRGYLSSDNTLKQLIGPISSSLILISDESLNMKHLDYYPLINPRAHSAVLKNKSNIRNQTFRETFSKFVKYLAEKGIKLWSLNDRLNLVQYLFQQERMDEGIEVFKSIHQTEGVTGSIQMDYLTAYVDFLLGYPKFEVATSICSKYLDYHILSWKLLFSEMWEQLQEFAGNSVEEEGFKEVGRDQIDKIQAKREIREGVLGVKLEESELSIEYTQQGASEPVEIEIKYYLIDLEVLFSRKPELFFEGEMGRGEEQDLSYVQPHTVRREKVVLHNGTATFTMKVEEQFRTKNILFEIRAQGLSKFATYYSNHLKIQIYENFGELKVQPEKLVGGQGEQPKMGATITPQGLSKVYVKCFSRMKNGDILFYKDGYTDIRGRFDYLSLNTPKFTKVQSFALFIAHPEYGSTIKTAKPPAGGITNIVDPELQVRTNLANKFNYREQQKAIKKGGK